MQIGHILGRNGIWREFYIQNCKIFALIISSKTLAEDDVSEPFDSISQIGHCFLRNGVQKNIKVRGPKYGFDERHQKTR